MKEQPWRKTMKYLGSLSGTGTITCNGKTVGRASYRFDRFFQPPNNTTSSGEIELTPLALEEIFGRKDVRLMTDDGRLLALHFSEKNLPAASSAAHVEVTGDVDTPPP